MDTNITGIKRFRDESKTTLLLAPRTNSEWLDGKNNLN